MNNSAQGKNDNAARLLLEYYGYDSLSYFTLHHKKKFFFSSSGKSFLSYIILNKVALVSGDPIGPETDIHILLREFNYFVKGAKLSTCFVGVHEKSFIFLRSIKHQFVHVGEEAIIPLADYQKKSLKKRVRRAERHIDSMGIICKIYSRKELPSKYLNQIREVSREWLMFKGGKERGLSMTLGRIPNLEDKDCEFVIALKDEKVLSYLTFVPSYASKSLSLDTSRRKKDSPNGLSEFLIIKALEYYKAKNIKQISLNFATFYKHDYRHDNSLFKILKIWIYKSLSKFYKTNKLYTFNEKFLPQWESRYIAFEKRRYIPRYLLAIARTELNI